MISPHTNLFSKSELRSRCQRPLSTWGGRGARGGDSLGDTRSLRRLCALADRPCADLVGPAGEVADEVEGGVAGGGDLAEGGDGADLLLLLGALLVRGEEGEALLEGDGEGDERVAGVVLVDPGLDLG